MDTLNDLKEKKTIGYYDREALNWTAAHGGNQEDSYWKVEMAKFYDLLPGGSVLEIGSGAGKDAASLISLDYDYSGIDASQGLLEIAKKRNPKGKFYCQNVNNLDFHEDCFDGFWCAATLLHIPKTRIDKALQNVKRVVKKGGIGFISLKIGIGESEDLKTGRWFSYYTADEFTTILQNSGFKIIESKIKDRTDGQVPWLVFFVNPVR